MEINRSNINEIVYKSNAKPDKDYGQNFLVEPEISKKIVNCLEVKDGDNVLEIGPGLGSLTNFLVSDTHNTTAVDIDSRMIDFLKVFYRDSNLKLILEDIRKVDVSSFDKIIGNLPYNITTELVLFLVLNATKCKKMVLMCQTEAFDRFGNLKGKEYGPVAILIYFLGNCKKLFQVKAGSFYPAPKCSSTVFEINFDESKDRELAISIYKLAKQLFLNRRKTILNNLGNFLSDKTKAEFILNKLGIPLTKRPEELEPECFANILALL